MAASVEPDQPRPKPLEFSEFKKYFADLHAGLNPELPRIADVMMNPGTNSDGWWNSDQWWLQMRLAVEIFESVFPSKFKLCVVIDWSQNHAAAAADALLADRMNVKEGGKQPHLKHTFYPREIANCFTILRPRNIECVPGCTECRAAFDACDNKEQF